MSLPQTKYDMSLVAFEIYHWIWPPYSSPLSQPTMHKVAISGWPGHIDDLLHPLVWCCLSFHVNGGVPSVVGMC